MRGGLQEGSTVEVRHSFSRSPRVPLHRRRLILQGQEYAQAVIAQDESDAQQDADENGEIKWLARAQVGVNSTTETGVKQKGAKRGGLGNRVDKRACEEGDSDGNRETWRPPKLSECLKDLGDALDFGDGVEEQEENQDGADDVPGPETEFLDGAVLELP